MIRFRNRVFNVFFASNLNIQVAQVTKKGVASRPQPSGFHRMEVQLWRLDQQTRSRAFSSGMPVAEIEEKHLLMTFLAFYFGDSNLGCVYRYGSISIHVWMYAYRYSTYDTYHHGSNVYNVYHRLSFVCTVYICIITASSSTINPLEIFQVISQLLQENFLRRWKKAELALHWKLEWLNACWVFPKIVVPPNHPF